jgi:Domain of unknown function (DUF4432)
MTRFKSWILTDVANDLWLDQFAAGQDTLRLPTPHAWSIRKRTLHGGLRDGIDLVEVHNGVLAFSLLPTRGMGIWRGDYRGAFLGWRAPVQGPVHPKFVQLDHRGGLGWLTGFDELLCRCGLANNGPPGQDVRTESDGQSVATPVTLHGRIANQPAHFVEVRMSLDPPHEMSVIGRVAEGGLFFPHMELTTTISTVPGSNRLVVHDVVENRGGTLAEMQMLYHCNVGQPFMEAGSRIAVPFREISPMTAHAAEDIDTHETFSGPSSGFSEQVFGYLPVGDAAGRTLALLYNAHADKGIVLRWNLKELPCFTLWRNTAALEDGYVTGLEPGTNYPNPKSFERANSRVRRLPPGGRWECSWSLEILDDATSVGKALAGIAELQAHAPAKVHRTPQAGISAAAKAY